MRQKEAAEAERKASVRAVEKLQKAVEKYAEVEKTTAGKMVCHYSRLLTYSFMLGQAKQDLEIQNYKAMASLQRKEYAAWNANFRS